MFESFFPEKMDEYSETLVKSISPNQVLEAIGEFENDRGKRN